MAISFVSSVVSSIEQVQEMELSNEEIIEAENICLHNCILWRNFLLSLLHSKKFGVVCTPNLVCQHRPNWHTI